LTRRLVRAYKRYIPWPGALSFVERPIREHGLFDEDRDVSGCLVPDVRL
jgi:hypothetical protein